jgi:hypothetical protein
MELHRLWPAVMVLFAIACDERPTVGTARPPYVPEFYTSERIEASVVDSESGEPVAGAVVVVLWRQVDTYSERWSELFGVAELVTDAGGRFTVQRWGPRQSKSGAYIDRRSPELWVLKSGYAVGFFDETGRKLPRLPADPAGGATIDYVTLPPNKMPGSTRGAYARAAEASSRWRGSTLPIDRIGSAPDLAASLGAANPFALDLHRTLSPLPSYWAEWHRSREQLPPELRKDVPFPPHTIVDYSIRSRATTP